MIYGDYKMTHRHHMDLVELADASDFNLNIYNWLHICAHFVTVLTFYQLFTNTTASENLSKNEGHEPILNIFVNFF